MLSSRSFYAAVLTCSYFGADAKHRPDGSIGGDVAGVGNAKSGSLTDRLTRDHRMTLDEAHLILNVKRNEAMEQIMRVRSILHTTLALRAR